MSDSAKPGSLNDPGNWDLRGCEVAVPNKRSVITMCPHFSVLTRLQGSWRQRPYIFFI